MNLSAIGPLLAQCAALLVVSTALFAARSAWRLSAQGVLKAETIRCCGLFLHFRIVEFFVDSATVVGGAPEDARSIEYSVLWARVHSFQALFWTSIALVGTCAFRFMTRSDRAPGSDSTAIEGLARYRSSIVLGSVVLLSAA